MVHVVIEGVDGVGKTTLINNLEEKFKGTVKNKCLFSYNEPSQSFNDFKEYIEDLNSYDGLKYDNRLYNVLIAFDRMHMINSKKLVCCGTDGLELSCRGVMSTLVYNTRDDLSDFEEVYKLNSFVPVPDLVIVLDCMCPVARERLKGRDGSTLEELEHVEGLIYKYREVVTLLSQKGWNIEVLDTTYLNEGSVLEFVWSSISDVMCL